MMADGKIAEKEHQKVIETSIIYFLPDNLFLRFIPEDYTFKYTEGNKVSDRDLRTTYRFSNRYLLESFAPKCLGETGAIWDKFLKKFSS